MFCRIFIAVFTILYLAAIFIFLTGVFGWFQQAKDPLSGVYLIPLGLPWVLGVDYFPEGMWPWLGAFAPALNLGILVVLCRWARSKRTEN